jgi:dipeptidyl aminopeptidase/acylaminoacyl peptidase
MLHLLRIASAFACAAIILDAAPGQTPPAHPPIEAFGNLPGISDVSLSPDGNHMAAIQQYRDRPAAVIYDLTNPSAQPLLIPGAKGFIVNVTWANNQRLLVTVNMNENWASYKVHAWLRTVSYDTNAKNPVFLLNNIPDFNVNGSTSSILDLAPDDPDYIYMSAYSAVGTTGYHVTIYKVDVNTGKGERVISGGGDTAYFVMDGRGNVVARLDTETKPPVSHVLVSENGNWREVGKFDVSGDKNVSLMGLADDGKSLLRMVTGGDAGTQQIAAMSIVDGKETILNSDPKYDIDGTLIDPYSRKVIGYFLTRDRTEYRYFDPQFQALQNGLEKAFPDKSVYAVDWDRSLNKMVVVATAPRYPTEYYLLDRATHRAELIGAAYPDLPPADLGEVSRYTYTARDGLTIPAYLTLPPGKNAKNLPVVIMPHGGPMARDDMSFDWEAQFLANRGYAVLQPNFRGSDGYGKKFLQAGYGEWGGKMQDDITDGLKKLIADGIADPKRICIVGASYGGYAALAGAAFTPDLYACAASWAGVGDIRKQLAEYDKETGGDTMTMKRLALFIGSRKDDADKLDAVSPVKQADKIKIPVLLMHGEKDYTVRVQQSEDMNNALRHAGKKVTYVAIPDETHHMQKASTRIRWLTELEKFLKENIGN